jgi:hypothetical protein
MSVPFDVLIVVKRCATIQTRIQTIEQQVSVNSVAYTCYTLCVPLSIVITNDSGKCVLSLNVLLLAEIFLKLTKAYEALTDPEARRKHLNIHAARLKKTQRTAAMDSERQRMKRG